MPSTATTRVRVLPRPSTRPEAVTPPSIPHSLDLIRKAELAERLRINRWTLMRWCREGKFPKPIRLSEVVVAWRVADVERWLSERAESAAS